MSLISRFTGDFDAAIRRRGASYYHRGHVRILSRDPQGPRVVAVVGGARSYQVTLEVNGEVLAADCTCAYFKTALCKHVWAVMMASDARRLLPQALHGEPSVLQPSFDHEDEYSLRGGRRRSGTGAAADARLEARTPANIDPVSQVIHRERVAAVQDEGSAHWAALLRQTQIPPAEKPEEPRHEVVYRTLTPALAIMPHGDQWQRHKLRATLTWRYGECAVTEGTEGERIVLDPLRQVIPRDGAAEYATQQRLEALGVTREHAQPDSASKPRRELQARNLAQIAGTLLGEGWQVEANGKPVRSAGEFRLSVASGVDWFELHGAADFGGQRATLPELMVALRRGESMIRLGDGSVGMLPSDWLQKIGLFTALGTAEGDHLRFGRVQAGLLDALLAVQPAIECDAVFARMRSELNSFNGIAMLEPPVGFSGELRPYQKTALAWFDFLRRFGFGGCLADDMGLGKTVQVLALLESRRLAPARTDTRPSLVVAPKSVIFNWKQEAARFAPALRVLEHTGIGRQRQCGAFENHDLILTTYGTLRADIALLREYPFDYVILDEAQAIKNAASVSAKSARLLQARHRLALSGTPIENHLGELWSLFEFLNPGMLGMASVFRNHSAVNRNPDEATRALLSQALRPFILRRTKEQVASELPPRVEQTLYCELDAHQRKLYDQLRNSYRAKLLGKNSDEALARSKIQVLEALLRLRQAALHPGLIDNTLLGEDFAKLRLLRERLAEVIDEGHKALVFSQFTGMLAILRRVLDADGISYAYLDGGTRDRQGAVEQFQQTADCKLFLISLKAGGTGLNLTAAQYVFLLDPWWNPAVEAQAIDRAHRIGQTQQVFAYRLIARDTVEEKMLELQNSKRELADAILGGNDGGLKNLSREDLELLLS